MKENESKKNNKFLRGVELIDKIIEYIKSGKSNIDISTPVPASKEVLNKLKIKEDIDLPPSMKRFMEFDISWLTNDFNLKIFEDKDNLKFKPLSVAETIRDVLDDEFYWTCFKILPAPMEQADCIPLDFGCETMRLLFLSKQDKYGEYLVLDIDIRNLFINLSASGFDTWLSGYSGFLLDLKGEYKKDHNEVKKSVFGNLNGLECDYFEK